MARANRHYIPGCVWHITHRCHKQEFLFKFAKDRSRYLYWLFEAKKRFGLKILNYIVTSNHVHLLLFDTGQDVIPKSIQLAAGRTAQEYNQRKNRKGAFWEDRYHATAIDIEDHLYRCIIYIDLNMVRTGKIMHPGQWEASGYNEIQNPPDRYTILDRKLLMRLCQVSDSKQMSVIHQQWITDALDADISKKRDAVWSESVAVGGELFLEAINEKRKGFNKRKKIRNGSKLNLSEPTEPYNHSFDGKKDTLSQKNTYLWDENYEFSDR
ncbi:MAG: transposase [Proteobacteria bacterium]|nr:transposase [Pseudomonadota bacterium]MBU1715903.1 transposase [Pseudomonadota bacterium]